MPNILHAVSIFTLLSTVTSHPAVTLNIRPPREPAAYSKVSDGQGSAEISLIAPVATFATPLYIEEFANIAEAEETDYIDHVAVMVNLTDLNVKPGGFYVNAVRNLRKLLPKLSLCHLKAHYVMYLREVDYTTIKNEIERIENKLNAVTWAFKTENMYLKVVDVSIDVISQSNMKTDDVDEKLHDIPLLESKKAEVMVVEESKPLAEPLVVKDYAVIGVLFVVNLLNYMDRLTTAGILTSIQAYYVLNDTQAGLIQTIFIVVFMLFAPLWGYLGDRYNRKWLMTGGLILWVASVLGASFCPENAFYMFLLLRGIMGIGMAGYSIVAPTVIADLFVGNVRSHVLMFFYFAIPFGSGLGYMVSSIVAEMAGSWQWGIRITLFFGIFCILSLIVVVPEPKREKSGHEDEDLDSSYFKDIMALLVNKTYVFSTLGVTFVMFVAGTLSWWVPTMIKHAEAAKQNLTDTSLLADEDSEAIGLYFGAITCVSGLVGVGLGSVTAALWKSGKACFCGLKTNKADALVSGIGSAVAAPLFFITCIVISSNMALAWVLMLFMVTALCLNWAIVVDMLMYIVPPSKRGAANAFQVFIGHALGDASGPYIIGIVSDWVRSGDDSPAGKFHSLIISFYIPNVLLVISAVAFFVSALTLNGDLNRLQDKNAKASAQKHVQLES
ncbi:unnamed protein product [Bursaphelenchus okinawaensis]|uniref:Major facilitator superfamily (MFS) profile domain-containing protein n=1 Tax=Bursaphelenchus okinawaensis TaxID=465554 RepID=A0A811L5S8_9BILA|nr:unnamed protein product [Bursaphelenchus okinawaensis]CAG9118268.1 unnamed protein product [Bursaphelenchus okinawaensis]